MGVLPSAKEIELIRRMHDERIAKSGVPCTIVNEVAGGDDRYGDRTDKSWSAPIETQITIDWSPKERFLKNLGWFKEGELPVVGQCKFVDEVRVNSIVNLTFAMPSTTIPQRFQVVDTQVFGVGAAMGLYVNLAPMRGSM